MVDYDLLVLLIIQSKWAGSLTMLWTHVTHGTWVQFHLGNLCMMGGSFYAPCNLTSF